MGKKLHFKLEEPSTVIKIRLSNTYKWWSERNKEVRMQYDTIMQLCKTGVQETAVRKINVDFELVVYPKLVKNSTFIKLKGVLIFLVPFRWCLYFRLLYFISKFANCSFEVSQIFWVSKIDEKSPFKYH